MQDQTKSSGRRPRGRPRQYDPDAALKAAREVFWTQGYNGASLEAIGAATGMNRPSLAAAFGSKQALYLRLIDDFAEQMRAEAGAALDREANLADALTGFYRAALGIYTSGDDGPRGCFVFCTAVAEAPVEPALRDALAAALRTLDAWFAARFARARKDGQLGPDADPKRLGALAAATLHSLSLRVRAGQPRATVEALIAQAVALLAPPVAAKKARTGGTRRGAA